jgi:uncharacterized protein YabE (DUF348 family)
MTLVSDPQEIGRGQDVTNPLRRWARFLRQWRLGAKFWRAGGILGVLVLLWAGYVGLGRPVTLVINNQPYPVRVHRLTVAGVLAEMGLALAPQDIVNPPLETRLSAGDSITVQLARPVTIEANGRSFQSLTHDHTISAVLAQTGITLNPRDEILVNGVLTTGDAPVYGDPPVYGDSPVYGDDMLPSPVPAARNPSTGVFAQLLGGNTPRGAITTARPEAVQLIVRRAVPVTLDDGQLRSTFYTTRPNVGEALLEQGLTLFLADKVTPSLSTPLSPGMRIYIERSIPVNVTVDGRLIKTRTRRETVGQILAQEGVALMGQDFTRPPLSQALITSQLIEVVRVTRPLKLNRN